MTVRQCKKSQNLGFKNSITFSEEWLNQYNIDNSVLNTVPILNRTIRSYTSNKPEFQIKYYFKLDNKESINPCHSQRCNFHFNLFFVIFNDKLVNWCCFIPKILKSLAVLIERWKINFILIQILLQNKWLVMKIRECERF